METPFPAYRGSEPYVFVCYSHEDSEVVFPELLRLRDAGVNIYYDEGISPGHEWTQELADAIDGANRFLYFVSPASSASRHCRNEVQYALEQGKSVVALHLEPTVLPGGLRLSIGSAQAILKHDLSPEHYQRKLAEALKLNAIGPVTSADVSSKGRSTRRLLTASAVVTGLVVLVVGFWWPSWEQLPTGQDVSKKEADVAVPPKLAVLPFTNLTNDPSQDYFSDGVSEDILTALARQATLVVRAWQSSSFFKGSQDPIKIAEVLDVGYLVSGSVRAQGDRVRVTVRLMDVGSNEDIWSARYDRDLADVFAVQDEIAQNVAAELGAQFSDAWVRSVDIAAYDALLLGRHYFYLQTFDLAEKHLLKAIEIDPTYADAHTLLARVYATQTWNQPVNFKELNELATAHNATALQLDPSNPQALGLRANSPTYPLGVAIKELHELITKYPDDEGLLFYYSTKMRHIGRMDLELKILQQAYSGECAIPLLMADVFYGRPAEAVRGLERCEALGLPFPAGAVQAALLSGDLNKAKHEAERPLADWFALPRFWKPIQAALVAYARNDAEGVERAMAPLVDEIDSQTSYVLYWMALLRGDTDEALRHYESALEQGEPMAYYFIRGSALEQKLFPEFWESKACAEMLRSYGLDSESVAKLSIPPLPF